MRKPLTIAFTALAFAAPLAVATDAQAGIEACGDIHVEANAECEVRGGIECEAYCEPVRFEAQCAANLVPECSGQCNASFTAECTTDCNASCMADCEAQPAEFDCQGSCYGRCEADAMASCSSDDGECIASARATCDAECQASCEATPPSLDCQAECQASCEGSCTADANVGCQIECQEPLYIDCKSQLEGGCVADCDTEAGALFCEGQYVDHGNNLADCVDALRALVNAHVEGYAEAECSGNECSAEAGFSCICTADPSNNGRTAALLTLGCLFVFGVARRRTR